MSDSTRRVLILGGTAESRALAAALDEAGVDVESSMAGRVAQPRMPAGRVRIGGFGGAAGLADHLTTEQVNVVVDATHPFATNISANAVAACDEVEVPLLRFARPGWGDHRLAPGWHWVEGYEQARECAEELSPTGRPFLTTGRQTLRHFTSWAGREVLVRVVEPLEHTPEGWTVLRDRGPYTLESERALLDEQGVAVLLTKDSGGEYTAAKLSAAADLGVPVVVVKRPPVQTGVRLFADLDSVLTTVMRELSQ